MTRNLDTHMYWGDWYFDIYGRRRWIILIPLWPALAAIGGTACLAWWLDTIARRRARAGFCLKCRYDRTGLTPSAVCPECGTPPA